MGSRMFETQTSRHDLPVLTGAFITAATPCAERHAAPDAKTGAEPHAATYAGPHAASYAGPERRDTASSLAPCLTRMLDEIGRAHV